MPPALTCPAPLQVAERQALAQKAYILFYIRREHRGPAGPAQPPTPGGGTGLHAHQQRVHQRPIGPQTQAEAQRAANQQPAQPGQAARPKAQTVPCFKLGTAPLRAQQIPAAAGQASAENGVQQPPQAAAAAAHVQGMAAQRQPDQQPAARMGMLRSNPAIGKGHSGLVQQQAGQKRKAEQPAGAMGAGTARGGQLFAAKKQKGQPGMSLLL